MILKSLASLLLFSSLSGIMAMDEPSGEQVAEKAIHKRTHKQINEPEDSSSDSMDSPQKKQRVQEAEDSFSQQDHTSALPVEMWANIFKYLEYVDLVSVLETSIMFKEHGQVDILWKALAQRNGVPSDLVSNHSTYIQSVKSRWNDESVVANDQLELARSHPKTRFKVDLAYGLAFGLFGQNVPESEHRIKNFNDAEFTITTALNHVWYLKTPLKKIRYSGTLYPLVPTKQDSQETVETSVNFPLAIAFQDLPIQVSWKVNSGHAGLNPPKESGQGVICWEDEDGDFKTKDGWVSEYYILDSLSKSEITSQMLFPKYDESESTYWEYMMDSENRKRLKTLVFTNKLGGNNFISYARIDSLKQPLDKINYVRVITEEEEDEKEH